MIQVRHNLFETNSSSTHSLVITTNDEWRRFMNNELVLDLYDEKLKEPAANFPKQNNEGKWEFEGKTYDNICDIPGTRTFEYYDRSNLFSEAFEEMCADEIEKDLGDGRIAVSIYAFED